jgi:hypothetical protein
MHTGARLDSATASTGAAAKPARKAQPKPELETTRASKFSVRAVRWFWPGRFALGKLGLVGGLPDKGKGLKSADIIARCTRGSERSQSWFGLRSRLDSTRMVKFMFLQYPAKIAGGDYEPDIAQ